VNEATLNALAEFVEAVSESVITMEAERQPNRSIDQRLRKLISARDALKEELAEHVPVPTRTWKEHLKYLATHDGDPRQCSMLPVLEAAIKEEAVAMVNFWPNHRAAIEKAEQELLAELAPAMEQWREAHKKRVARIAAERGQQ
jgi:septal ring factor EnvC (AmiA/AmiB activator)